MLYQNTEVSNRKFLKQFTTRLSETLKSREIQLNPTKIELWPSSELQSHQVLIEAVKPDEKVLI